MTQPMTPEEYVAQQIEEAGRCCGECQVRFRAAQDYAARAFVAGRAHGLEEAGQVIDKWHYKKGGYCELAFAIRALLEAGK